MYKSGSTCLFPVGLYIYMQMFGTTRIYPPALESLRWRRDGVEYPIDKHRCIGENF